MALPIYVMTEKCRGKPHFEVKENEIQARRVLLACDILIFITLFVVSLLQATSVLTLPPAASYTLSGVICGVLLLRLWYNCYA